VEEAALEAKAIAIPKAPPISGLRPPRKNAYGRPMSNSSVNLPVLMRWITLTTPPSAPAISAATRLDQWKAARRADDRDHARDRCHAAEIDHLRLAIAASR
jgi:hypothetical protein